MPRRTLIAGNWKMHGLQADLGFFAEIADAASASAAEILVCPPSTLLHAAAGACRGTAVRLGGQDCHADTAGAHTGDISAQMLRDAGAGYVIVGHSERRADHGETDAIVRAKAEAAMAAGLTPIVCIGETREQRERGEAADIVSRQLSGSLPTKANGTTAVIAYEPVWAIGTGLTASQDDVAEMHATIRAQLDDFTAFRILYGGSVKPANAAALLALTDVDGALVGGASLESSDFRAIVAAAGCMTAQAR